MATPPPARPPRPPRPAPRGPLRLTLARPKRRWPRRLLFWLGVPALVALAVGAYLWVDYGRLIDAKFGGEARPLPRIWGRPYEIRAGLGLSPDDLLARLNALGYTARDTVGGPGEFTAAADLVTLIARPADGAGARRVDVHFSRGRAPVVTRLVVDGRRAVDRVVLEAPLLTAFARGEKRRHVPLAAVPARMVQAVLAIEDRRFFDHPGIDPIRVVGALLTNLRGDRPYLVGGSTLTQQIVKNTVLTPEKTMRRKLQEQFMALVLESRLTKDQILELYLNDVVLGQRGPFAIRGVAEAARIFFGKDVTNVTLAEAATIAGVIQSPSRLSPFRNPERALERRNLVLREMAGAGFIEAADAEASSQAPLGIAPRALENEAPYFVDYVAQIVEDGFGGLLKQDSAVDVHTTLDLHLQHLAQEAVAAGLAEVDRQIAGRRGPAGQAQAALVAVDPRTGDILAFVGGRSYSQSQFNRVVAARRQPGSAFKPFVFLAAFERMAEEGRDDLTPATVLVDEPTVFPDGDKDYTPANYQNEYDGPVTLRRALARSRNIVAIKVAEATGYERVAALWRRIGVGTPARPYPSIALGVFEASPLEMATAYTIFTSGGAVRPLRAITRVAEGDRARPAPVPAERQVARADTTFLVTHMLRSVMNEGTGAGARANGFTLDAAGKSGTTNDLRDAWFVGFTPELLTAVWVGFDDNRPIGLSGSQAALPIWTAFMKRALAARSGAGFEPPDGIVFADIDHETGGLATPFCPRVFTEAFLAGAEPRAYCELHGGRPRPSFWSRLGHAIGRIIRD